MMFNETPKMYSEQNQLGQPEAFKKLMEHQAHEAKRQAQYGGAIAGAEQVKQGGIALELRHVEKNIAALTAEIDLLANKLAPLIRPRPEKEGVGVTGRDANSELAEFMRRNNQQLQMNIDRIRQLTEGIDL